MKAFKVKTPKALQFLAGPVFAIAIAVLAIGGMKAPRSEAAVENLNYTQTCQPDGSLSVTFSWPDVNIYVVQQWLDLSLFDNGWQAGSFIGNGPLAASQQSVTWSGLRQGLTHYVRVNQWMPSGNWEASPTFYFTTQNCTPVGGTMQPPPINGGSNTPIDPNLKQIPAPIDDAKVVPGTTPGTFVVQVKAGLPGGCAKQGGTNVTQSGNVITVQVFDTLPTDTNIACTAIYGSYNLSVDLPKLTPGTPYEIHVNDKVLSFVIP